MTTIRVSPENESMVRIYVKGAPEEIFKLCDLTYDKSGNEIEFDEEYKNVIEEEYIAQKMAV